MNAPLFIQIPEAALLPFIWAVYPDGHRFMQDNGPKHISILAATFMRGNGLNWWQTPLESPDCNVPYGEHVASVEGILKERDIAQNKRATNSWHKSI